MSTAHTQKNEVTKPAMSFQQASLFTTCITE